jgi:hypothetical protein
MKAEYFGVEPWQLIGYKTMSDTRMQILLEHVGENFFLHQD